MTQEEKAKAYDKAKYIMEEYLKSGNAGVIAENTIKKAFPEFKESEDEKIRKELIDIVKKSPITFAFEDKGKVLAWLEKQGKQKSAWSKEDENVFGDIEEAIMNYWYGDTQDILLEWLASIKEDRINS